MDRAAAGRGSCALARGTTEGRTPTFAEQAALLLLDAAAEHDRAGGHVLADSFRQHAREVMRSPEGSVAVSAPPTHP